MAQDAVCGRVGRDRVGTRIWWPRAESAPAGDLVRGAGVRKGYWARRVRRRVQSLRTHPDHARQRGAEEVLPAEDSAWRDTVVPGILRVRSRLGSGRAAHARSDRRGRTSHHRIEDLDV